MASHQPVVLDVQSACDFVHHVLDYHAVPSTLVVCSTKTAFLEALQAEPAAMEEEHFAVNTRKLWQTPTLRLLSTSRTLKVVFCPELTHLRAYIATYSTAVSKRTTERDDALRLSSARPILALLDPIQLHRTTSAFSAQGMNRTFAMAVEAAHHTNSQLILAEIAPQEPTPDVGLELQIGMAAENRQPSSLWDEHVPILNASTKRLGELSTGRTVKIKTVAERWCTFDSTVPPNNG